MDDRYADLRAALDDGSLTLDHVAVAEDEGLRWMSGRKMPAGVPPIELHGITGGARVHGHIAANPETIRALLAERDALREALWVATEHNALHFGESHNTVIQGRAALAQEGS